MCSWCAHRSAWLLIQRLAKLAFCSSSALGSQESTQRWKVQKSRQGSELWRRKSHPLFIISYGLSTSRSAAHKWLSTWPFMAICATRRQIAGLLLASDQCQLVFTHVGCGLGKPSAGLPLVLPTHWTCTLCSLQPSKMLGRDPRFRSLAPGVELPKKPSVPAATRWLGSRLFRNSEALASHPWNQQQ